MLLRIPWEAASCKSRCWWVTFSAWSTGVWKGAWCLVDNTTIPGCWSRMKELTQTWILLDWHSRQMDFRRTESKRYNQGTTQHPHQNFHQWLWALDHALFQPLGFTAKGSAIDCGSRRKNTTVNLSSVFSSCENVLLWSFIKDLVTWHWEIFLESMFMSHNPSCSLVTSRQISKTMFY